MKTFEIEAREATINRSYESRKIVLSFNAEPDEVAELLTVADVVAHFDLVELLDAIGSDKSKEHFGLVDEEA